MILKKELIELELEIPNSDLLKTSVSTKEVKWHIDHSLKVIIGIANALKNSKPEDFKSSFNLTRTYIFLLGFIPRGKGKAPKSVVAQGEIQHYELIEQLNQAKIILKKMDDFPAKSHFDHPYFGKLNLRQSIAFLEIHTKHHLKIIRDIIQK
ncbi:MAG: hypothetical protein H0V01_06960 [Bacteroidetes bacterium]|nr:hypothetical protein [Bacteroidota bacterium]HET6245941.1 hypothetical protein [Bacteroidia bacterium]